MPVRWERRELTLADELRRNHDEPNRRERTQCGRADSALEQCTLADHRPRPHFGDLLPVDLHAEDAVEEEVELVSLRALRAEPRPLAALSLAELLVSREECPRQLALERALRLGDDGRRLLVAPGRVVAARLAVPLLEVDGPALLDHVTLAVVDPMTRERARTDQLVLDAAVGVQRECERRPRGGRLDPEQRPALDQPRCREARASADGLHEPHPVSGHLRVGAQNLERHPGHDDRLGPEAERRGTDEPASLVAETDDRAVLDLDPRLQLVRLAEAVGVPEPLQVAPRDPVGRRVVVVADPELERQLWHSLDRLGRNPRDRGD